MNRKIRILFIFLIFGLSLSGPLAADVIFYGPHDVFPRFHYYQYNTSQYYLWVSNAGHGEAGFYIPIHLPEGSKITAMTAFYEDNHAGNVHVAIYRQRKYAIQGANLIVEIVSSGATPGLQIVKSTSVDWSVNMIQNSACTYWAVVYFDTDAAGTALTFHGLKVFYK